MQNDHLFVRHYENKIGELWFLGYSIAKYQTSLIKDYYTTTNRDPKSLYCFMCGLTKI